MQQPRLSDEAKASYQSEVAARKVTLENAKMALELWHARRLPEKAIVEKEKVEYDKLMNDADVAIRDFVSTATGIRKAHGPVS